MRVSTLASSTIALAVVAMLAGCGGSSSQTSPMLATGRPPDMARQPGSAHRSLHRSWMNPDAKHDNLLYVATAGNNAVEIYSYPKTKLVGTLTNLDWPEGLCSDRDGNVWVTNFEINGIYPGYMSEYAHGGTTPIATLQDGTQSPKGCSVDPTTGNLAVANTFPGQGGSGSGNVAIYKKAQGDPVFYTDPDIYYPYFCTYDDKGNLFVNGFSPGSQVTFSELPKGSKKFVTLTLDKAITWPVGLQWHWNYLAVGNGTDDNPIIYQFAISGNKGTSVGFTQLNGGTSMAQFTVFRKRVIVPEVNPGLVGVWSYPAGGPAIKMLQPEGGNEPVGTAISKAP